MTNAAANVAVVTLISWHFSSSVAFTYSTIGFGLTPLAMSRRMCRFGSTHASSTHNSLMQMNTAIHTSIEDETSHHHMSVVRRTFVESMIGGVFLISSPIASAANLPSNLGADLTKTGTVETLIPIVAIEQCLINASLQLTKSTNGMATPEVCSNILLCMLTSIPRDENSFKRIFDAYSTPVSYKQKFLDQNAFLVYYTKGFDGPGRPRIEEEDARDTLQTLQYGARNDLWSAMENLFVELEFGKTGEGDSTEAELSNLIDRTLSILDSYLKLAPVADVEQVRLQLGQ